MTSSVRWSPPMPNWLGSPRWSTFAVAPGTPSIFDSVVILLNVSSGTRNDRSTGRLMSAFGLFLSSGLPPSVCSYFVSHCNARCGRPAPAHSGPSPLPVEKVRSPVAGSCWMSLYCDVGLPVASGVIVWGLTIAV